MNKVITIDLGRYPLKWIFAGIVLLLTIISSYGEKSHAAELNRLPRNRTELTNIKSANITYNGKDLIVDMFIDYIFYISIHQHYYFLHLDIIGSGYSITMETKNADYVPALRKNFMMQFSVPGYGDNMNLTLYRSKSYINSTVLDLKYNQSPNTTISCKGKNTNDRTCTVHNVCFTYDRLFWFGKHNIQFQEPFIKFNGQHTFSGKKAMKQPMSSYLASKGLQDTVKNPVVAVAFTGVELNKWNWIYNVAAPLSVIASNPKYDTVYALRTPTALKNHPFLTMLGNIVPVFDDHICADEVHFAHLEPSHNAVENLKTKVSSALNEKVKESKALVFLSNESSFNVSNIIDVAKAVCNTTDVKTIIAEEYDEVSLISIMIGAQYIFSPTHDMLSYVFWMKSGIFVEFIPAGAECLKSISSMTQETGTKHIRFSIGSNTTKTEPLNEQCAETYTQQLLKGTASVDINVVLQEMSNQ